MTPVEGSTDKRLWYKSWWGMIIALILFPLFIFWWVWKKADLKPNLRKGLTVIAAVFAVMFYGVIGFALADMPGTPLINVSRSTETQTVSIPGSNADPNNNVTLILNGSEYKTIQASNDGKFTFDSVALNEGNNTVKTFTVRANGKRKESAEYIIAYHKPQEAHPVAETVQQPSTITNAPTEAVQVETKPVEQPTNTAVATTTTQTAKEPATIDQLWTILDKTIKSRNGFDIKFNESSGVVVITKQPSGDSWDETDFVRTAVNDFVKYGLETFKLDAVNSLDLSYFADMTNSHGKTEAEKGVQLSIDETEFNKYDWHGLVGQNVYQQMVNSAGLWIYPGIKKGVNTDKIKLYL